MKVGSLVESTGSYYKSAIGIVITMPSHISFFQNIVVRMLFYGTYVRSDFKQLHYAYDELKVLEL